MSEVAVVAVGFRTAGFTVFMMRPRVGFNRVRCSSTAIDGNHKSN